MRPITVDDVLPLDAYMAARERIRAAVRAMRAARRVLVGDRLSLSFENRDTVLFQVQEMLRVEELTDPRKVAEEVEIYNDLVAGDDELRATFFVEITERSRIKHDLDSLVGLEREGLWLSVDGVRVPAEFEPGHAREDRISAVHFVRFVLGAERAEAMRRRRAAVEVVVDHPAYRAGAVLGEQTLAALAEDLGGAPSPSPVH